MKHLDKIITLAGLLVLACTPVHAEEGGGGHYLPGVNGTLIDLLPTEPGFILQPIYLYYDGDSEGSSTFPIAGKITAHIDAKVNSVSLGGLYTFDRTFLGARYTVGVYAPYVWQDVTATVSRRFWKGQARGQGGRLRRYYASACGSGLEERGLAVRRAPTGLCTDRLVQGGAPRKSGPQLLDV